VIRRAAGPSPVRLAATALVTVGMIGVLSACSTTYDTSATTPPSAAAVTTLPLAAATTDEQLAAIAAEVGALSERLVDNDAQRDALARIQVQWAAARPTIAADRPELLDGFDSAMAQVERSVERRRPADADKAARSLSALIAAFER
jgi:hypothetical protein